MAVLRNGNRIAAAAAFAVGLGGAAVALAAGGAGAADPQCWQVEEGGSIASDDAAVTARPATDAAALEAELQVVEQRVARYRSGDESARGGPYDGFYLDVETAHLEALQEAERTDEGARYDGLPNSTWVARNGTAQVAEIVIQEQPEGGWIIESQRWGLPDEVCKRLG